MTCEPLEFVTSRRGCRTTREMERKINGPAIGMVKEAFMGWSGDRSKDWAVFEGECRVSLGLRKITFEQFKERYIRLHANGVSDDYLYGIFKSIPDKAILRDGHIRGEWLFIGYSTLALEDYGTQKEMSVWTNIGEPDWDMKAPESFTRPGI